MEDFKYYRFVNKSLIGANLPDYGKVYREDQLHNFDSNFYGKDQEDWEPATQEDYIKQEFAAQLTGNSGQVVKANEEYEKQRPKMPFEDFKNAWEEAMFKPLKPIMSEFSTEMSDQEYLDRVAISWASNQKITVQYHEKDVAIDSYCLAEAMLEEKKRRYGKKRA